MPSPVMGEPPFIHSETKMAARLGLSRDETRALRQQYLTKWTHWKLVKRRVYLTEEAVHLLLSKKGLPPPTPSINAALPQNAARPRQLLLMAPFEGELVVWNVCHNTRILLAIFPQDHADNPQTIVRIMVKSNKNFVAKMKVRARHIEKDLYELVGACPRWRGKY